MHRSHRIIREVLTSEEAEKIRHYLLGFKPRPCVYVFLPGVDTTLYSIGVANFIGIRPDDKCFADLESYLASKFPVEEVESSE